MCSEGDLRHGWAPCSAPLPTPGRIYWQKSRGYLLAEARHEYALSGDVRKIDQKDKEANLQDGWP